MTELNLTEKERVCKGCSEPVMKIAEAPKVARTAFGGLLKALMRCGNCGRVSYVVRSVSRVELNVGRYQQA